MRIRTKLQYRLIVLTLLGTLLVNTCASPPIDRYDHIYIPEDAYGIAHAGEDPEDYMFLYAVGAQWIRQTFRWDSINPAPGEWDFDRFDRVMDFADEHRIKVIAVLAYDVGWIHTDRKPARYIDKDQLAYYLEYVAQTVTHYKGRVDAWEIWNEPNVTFWKGSNQEFYRLCLAAIPLIKEIDPETPVLVGATFRVPSKFIHGLIDSRVLEAADALSIHPYGINPAETARLIQKAISIVEENHPGKQVWITEIGYPTRGIFPTKAGGSNFTPYVIKTLVAAVTSGIRVTVWFRHFDKPPDSFFQRHLDSGIAFGLADCNGALKDGGTAFSLFTRYTAGCIFDPDGVNFSLPAAVASGIRSALFRNQKEGSAFLVVWMESDSSLEICIRDGKPGNQTIDILEIELKNGLKTSSGDRWYGLLDSRPRLYLIRNIGESRLEIVRE